MKNLEITQKTCANKIRSLIHIITNEEEVKCLNCNNINYQYCNKYKPIERTNLRWSYLRLYGGKQ